MVVASLYYATPPADTLYQTIMPGPYVNDEELTIVRILFQMANMRIEVLLAALLALCVVYARIDVGED